MKGVIKMINLQEFKKNEVIIKEHDIDESLYLIESGQVQVYREKEDGEIILANLTSGSFFGEMALIDDRPRSASIRASEKTLVKVFHRKDFLKVINDDQDLAIKFLSGIFSRLRDANSKTQNIINESEILTSTNLEDINDIKSHELLIEGLNEKSKKALPENPLKILVNKSPFNVGRISSDPFSNKQLGLLDTKPMQISRNHFCFQIENNKIALYDIGSSLGLILNDSKLGGRSGAFGPLYLNDYDNILILGTENSGYEFKIINQTKSVN